MQHHHLHIQYRIQQQQVHVCDDGTHSSKLTFKILIMSIAKKKENNYIRSLKRERKKKIMQ